MTVCAKRQEEDESDEDIIQNEDDLYIEPLEDSTKETNGENDGGESQQQKMPTKKQRDTDSSEDPQQPNNQKRPSNKQLTQQEDTDSYERPQKPKKQKMSIKQQTLVNLMFLELIHVPVI